MDISFQEESQRKANLIRGSGAMSVPIAVEFGFSARTLTS